MKISLKIAVCGIILVAFGGICMAGFAKPEEAIGYRKAVMRIIGHHIGQLAAVVKGQAPFDQEKAIHDATVIESMSQLPWEAVMTSGSDMGDTTLKKSAMQEKDKFMAIAHQFESDATSLAEAAENGDLDAVKAQFGQVVKNCKECHSTYRNK